MKKALTIGILVTVAAFAAASFTAAAAPTAPQPMARGTVMDAAAMQEMHKTMSRQMVESGMMSAEQAQTMDEWMAAAPQAMGQGGMYGCTGPRQQNQ